MADWFLGVDAGGSGTRAALWRYDSLELHAAEAGPGNPWSAGVLAAGDAIESACSQVFGLAGMHPGEISSAVFGIAGHGRQGVPAGFLERFQDWGLPPTARITSDLEIATVAGLGETSGVHVIAGSGSALMVQHSPEERETLGGWGWFLGDPGSAFDLGHRALRWWVESWDGGMRHSILGDHLIAWSGIETPLELQSRIADPRSARPWIALLARAVLAAAEKEDRDGLEILHSSIGALVKSIRLARAKLTSSEGAGLSISGGLTRSRVFTDCLQRELSGTGTSFDFVKTVSNPIVGALRMAEKSINASPCDHLSNAMHCHFA